MNQDELIGFIGTYTKGESEGIYRFILDVKLKEIRDIEVVVHIEDPTYFAIRHDNQYLYSVAKNNGLGGVVSFLIDTNTKQLTELNRQMVKGPSPCHVSINSKGNRVVAANYHKGTLQFYMVNRENGILEGASITYHSGSGPNKERQERPHVHYAGFAPNEAYVIAVDLGIDQLMTYKEKEGRLTEIQSLSVHPGSGPRHLVFHPNGNYAYVLTELSSEVIVLTYDKQRGRFQQIQSISALPKAYGGSNYGSAIQISSDGEFIYAANRGHNSIAIFRVNQDSGKLTFLEAISTEGNWPRDFTLDPTEHFIIVVNERSNNLILFSRNKTTGQLTLVQSNVSVPSPVCVKFLHKE
ncbi:lactonase family protein [Bacillus cytotoxicus]|uniref:lactonase family protein n=1 Tax=Bacillus cytotoxicus TaxID=580165 RepID=UPI0008646B12|nr:lactonase family protein [Bacillus cytotoxicus]AWC29317.1 6-phosphogluconolactonase [Bacillus cytotoxicus]AWC41443.1 6-phosphogluconolactonase [Bacillus cytotoxicus]AWC49374.1 6-phosphogluconolactonase [Bacillus cytotoxicus]AWC53389.1 6-phosphogluconolactonase [Bacillus cytotoxicus]AWC57516.1 6-phosphogluconolactonase [Bacillus cytotoxicus]